MRSGFNADERRGFGVGRGDSLGELCCRESQGEVGCREGGRAAHARCRVVQQGRRMGVGHGGCWSPVFEWGRSQGLCGPPEGAELAREQGRAGLAGGPGALGGRCRRWRSVSRQSSACVRLRESCFPVPRAPWLARLRASARPSASPAAHADAGGARRGPSANSGGAGNVAAERSGAARGLTSTGLMRTPCSFETRRSGAKLSPGDVCLGKKVK